MVHTRWGVDPTFLMDIIKKEVYMEDLNCVHCGRETDPETDIHLEEGYWHLECYRLDCKKRQEAGEYKEAVLMFIRQLKRRA